MPCCFLLLSPFLLFARIASSCSFFSKKIFRERARARNPVKNICSRKQIFFSTDLQAFLYQYANIGKNLLLFGFLAEYQIIHDDLYRYLALLLELSGKRTVDNILSDEVYNLGVILKGDHADIFRSPALLQRPSHLGNAAAGDVDTLQVLVIPQKFDCLFVSDLRILKAVQRGDDLDVRIFFMDEVRKFGFTDLNVIVVVLGGDRAGNHCDLSRTSEELTHQTACNAGGLAVVDADAAGSLCPVELMKQVEEKMYMKVTSVYGLTEAAPGMTATRIDDSFDVRCNTVGRDFEFTEVRVIDPETGEECPVGVQGEMCNRGYNTMKGYYKNPEATAEVIDKDNFLHSGDLGIKDEDGNYRITGRIKDMIIRGGENIYPREIEEFLYKLDGVKDVQVAGIPSKKYGEAVGAFIILQEGVKMHESDVRDFCKNKISRYKIPKYVFFVKEFPMTGSGKIQKFRLKDLGLQLCKEQGIEII